MRKVILYIAVTLDGYIADNEDGFAFLHEYDSIVAIQQSYEKLMKRIDTIIMGRTTYEVISKLGEWPYSQTQSYIVSHKDHPVEQPFTTWVQDPVELVQQLKEKSGQDIWLVGGGQLIKTFLEHQLIDEYQIAVIPKLIGSGKRLFPNHEIQDKLKLHDVQRMDEIVMLTYTK